MKEKNKLIITIIVITLIAVVIVGATYAYWSWTTATNEQTNVTFTVTSGFSCGADGGGSITSQQKILAPTSCTNPNYAFQRTITTNVTNNRDSSVYMDLYLQVNSIGSGLAASQNFRYALTEQANDCTSNVISSGTFTGATTNTKKYLFSGSEYPTTGNHTYYLYVWLDAAETDNATQNQAFDISLGGECTDSPYVYTVNIYESNTTNNNSVIVGQTIPNKITKYTTPVAAMAAYNNNPFYLKHLLVNDIVTESYVEFVVTPAMAQANSGVTAGTYTLRGGVNERSSGSKPILLQNAKTIYDAFGSNCSSNPYNTAPSSYFYCGVSGLYARAGSDGEVKANDGASASCDVLYGGRSRCSE